MIADLLNAATGDAVVLRQIDKRIRKQEGGYGGGLLCRFLYTRGKRDSHLSQINSLAPSDW